MEPVPAAMTHRAVLQAMSGLLLALFVVMLSGTVVTNALPPLVVDLDGSQDQYTWVVAASLLTLTVSGPLWGKAADRASRTALLKLAIALFVVSSALAGLAPTIEALIVFRAVEGVGAAGVVALSEVVMASMVSPRQRGRYMGYFGAVGAVATIGGPLVGGLVVDAPALGWRWCFWLAIPFAVVAWILVGRTLDLAVPAARARIDWGGALLIPSGVGVLLVWITVADTGPGWVSWGSAALVLSGAALLAVAVSAERRAADPVVPPRLLRQRTFLAAVVAIAAIGVAVVGTSVFFAQYFQIARGLTPTASGMAMIPMMAALLLATTVAGRFVTRTGRLRGPLVCGAMLLVAGLALLGTIDRTTPLGLVGGYLVVMGLGVGMCVPNLLLAVQNTLRYGELGVGTATFTFFHSLGGATGVAVFGAVFGAQLTALLQDRLPRVAGGEVVTGAGAASLDLDRMSPQTRTVIEQAYADATGSMFLVGAAVAAIALVAVCCLRTTELRGTVQLVEKSGRTTG